MMGCKTTYSILALYLIWQIFQFVTLFFKKRTLALALLQNYTDSPHARSFRGLLLCVALVGISEVITLWCKETQTGRVWNKAFSSMSQHIAYVCNHGNAHPAQLKLTDLVPVIFLLILLIVFFQHGLPILKGLSNINSGQTGVFPTTTGAAEKHSCKIGKTYILKSLQHQFKSFTDDFRRTGCYLFPIKHKTASFLKNIKLRKMEIENAYLNRIKSKSPIPLHLEKEPRQADWKMDPIRPLDSIQQSNMDAVVCAVPYTDTSDQLQCEDEYDERDIHPTVDSDQDTLLYTEFLYIQSYMRRTHTVSPIIDDPDIDFNNLESCSENEEHIVTEIPESNLVTENGDHTTTEIGNFVGNPSVVCCDEKTLPKSYTDSAVSLSRNRTNATQDHNENSQTGIDDDLCDHSSFSPCVLECPQNQDQERQDKLSYTRNTDNITAPSMLRNSDLACSRKYACAGTEEVFTNTDCLSQQNSLQLIYSSDDEHQYAINESETEEPKTDDNTGQNHRHRESSCRRSRRASVSSCQTEIVSSDNEWSTDQREYLCRNINEQNIRRLVEDLPNMGPYRVKYESLYTYETCRNENTLCNTPVQESEISIRNQNRDYISLRATRRLNPSRLGQILNELFCKTQLKSFLDIVLMQFSYQNLNAMSLLISICFALARRNGVQRSGSHQECHENERESELSSPTQVKKGNDNVKKVRSSVKRRSTTLHKQENDHIPPLPFQRTTRKCRFCRELPVVRFVPCNHAVCCAECTMKVSACPQCRMSIVEFRPEHST